jgi:hypothetical protein
VLEPADARHHVVDARTAKLNVASATLWLGTCPLAPTRPQHEVSPFGTRKHV